MVQLIMNESVMFDLLDRSHREAAAETLAKIQHELQGPGLVGEENRVRTGRLARSFHLVEHESARSHPVQGARRRKIFIVSDAPHANAVEWGANTREIRSVRSGTLGKGIYATVNGKRKLVGRHAAARDRLTRKGPHMKGNHVVAEQGPTFLEHMGYRLSEGNR